MRSLARVGWTAWLAVGFLLLTVSPAAAYLDPGTGSIIFQAVIAGAMAVSVGVKVFWSRIRRVVSRRSPSTTDDVSS